MTQEVVVRERPAKRSYREILTLQIREGLSELKRPGLGLFVSALAAGLEVSFSVLLMGVAVTLIDGTVTDVVRRVISSSLYTVGFIFVILGRSELFTEHTTLAVLPVLNRRASFHSLLRLWGIIWAGNIVGTILFSFMMSYLGPQLEIIEPEAFSFIAAKLVSKTAFLTISSAVLAGWLMGLLSWLVAASRDTIGQIVLVWLVTFSIGLAQLNHAIVGSTEVLSAVLSGMDITFEQYVRFVVLSTIGNAIGGAFFVAFMKYRHATSSR